MSAAMTPRERLIAAARREPVDRIPFSPRLGPTYLGYAGSDLVSTLDLARRFGFDPHHIFAIRKDTSVYYGGVPTATYTEGVNTTVTVRDEGDTLRVTSVFETPAGVARQVKVVPKTGRGTYGANPNPHIAEYLIKERADLDKARFLLPPRSTWSLADFHEYDRDFHEEALMLLTVMGPMDHSGGNLCEMTHLMEAYYEDRSLFDAVFQLFGDFCTETLAWAIERGVRQFFLVWFYESLSSGWSPAIYREVFLPILKRQTAMIHDVGGLVWMYDDGKLMDALPLLVEAGVDCIQTCSPAPLGDFDIIEAKRRHGAQLTFMGGVDHVNVLARGTPEEVDRAVRHLAEHGAPGSGLIIGTADSIRPETSAANLEAYLKAGNRYARQFAHLTR